MPGKKQKIILFIMLLWICAPLPAYSQEIKQEKLPDGVEHWYYAKQGKNQFSKLLENIINAVVNNPPFGKSVAFLVGVSRYEYLSPQLPFVKNDLELLREFLLKKGGFDEVYVAADKTANAGLIEEYILNNRMGLENGDRLLFYYSGHGADYGGRTGYIQFSKAKSNEFIRDQYLAISRCEEWSRMLRGVKHVLFIYDCCVSGLAFTHKSGAADSKSEILSTLSGNGSRTVITAGTADEKTFGVDNHSVFTKAFLDALNTSQNINGFMTMNEIFARIKRRVKDFSRQYDKKLTPRRWELEEDRYRGTFLFVDSSAKGVELPDEYREPLKIKPTPKGQSVASYGIIHLISYVSGRVCIDDQCEQNIESGDAVEFSDMTVGEHTIEVRSGSGNYRQSVNVEKGKIQRVTIRAEAASPKAESKPVAEVPKKKPAPQPQAEKPKYQLRKEPMTVSGDDFKKVFGLNENQRPLEYIQNDFRDNGNGTITDNATGLMWQKSGSDNYMPYEDAPAYIGKINREKFAGHSDWRLPTVDELKSLLTPKKMNGDLYIAPIFDKKQSWCWTSDNRASGGAWHVGFLIGLVLWYDLGDGDYVRAVRLRQ